jgi:hypothetical protein
MSPELKNGRARLYVSFADDDRARVMQLVRWLNDSGWQVQADDRHSFASGENWTGAAATRLDSCDVILCVITPRWLESDFCRLEFSYGVKRGKFILPVICEPTHVGNLPPEMRALPRIDLTRNRLLDYLALKETLNQAAAKSESFTTTEGKAARGRPVAVLTGRASLWLALAALLLIAIAAMWLWTFVS